MARQKEWYNVCLAIYKEDGKLFKRTILATVRGQDFARLFKKSIEYMYKDCDGVFKFRLEIE